MSTGLRRSVVVVAGMLLAGTGGACDWTHVLGDRDLPPPTSSHKPVPDAAAPDATPVVTPDGATAPDSGSGNASYDAMCRHYCQTLAETDVLVCAASVGGDAESCTAKWSSTTDECFDLRCGTGRVGLPLCLEQCDALATDYNDRCPVVGPSSDPLCPASQAAHDAACRAGCVL
ncbi:MAG TPA: hypothetical protein VGP07_20930 [Polyangia bacterium]|jgi:hypothetical protein